MSHFNFEIASNDRTLDAYLAPAPSKGGRQPGIVLLTEIFGVNAAMRLAADELANEGFVVLVPDLFNQVSPRMELGYSEAEREQAIAIWQKMDDAISMADSYAAVTALRQNPKCNGKVAALGFCLGGKYALQMAAAGGVDASVSFYPVRVQDYSDSLRNLKCPTLTHVGDQDAHIPKEVHEILSHALREPGKAELHLYPGAGHGFYNSVRTFGYVPEAAHKARERSVKFLREALAY